MINKRAVTQKDAIEMTQAFHRVKMFAGVANNAAAFVMLHAYGQISGRAVDADGNRLSPHRNYRYKVKAAYHRAINAFHVYENRLRLDDYFDTKLLGDADRKRYGDISRDDFFYLWKGMGNKAYTDSLPLLNSLWNKHRLSLKQHGIKEAEKLAWAMVAQACLDLAEYVFEHAVSSDNGVLTKTMEKAFSVFRIKPVADAWRHAITITDPQTQTYELEPVEERNIELGITQLYEKWMEPRTIFESVIAGTLEQGDVFRTPGEAKKAAREWRKLWDEFEEKLLEEEQK